MGRKIRAGRAQPREQRCDHPGHGGGTGGLTAEPRSIVAAVVGVLGGSGFYRFLEDVEEVVVETPYGSPSAPIAVGGLEGVRVAFLPRHGVRHELPPHRIPYRANVWALREVGVRRILAPNASGALRGDLQVGDLVVPDQYVDRTSGREDSFYDGPETRHVSAAEPYCPDLRRLVLAAALELGLRAQDGGTVVTIQGPRFSTVSESRWYRSMGWDVVNMTAYPEAHLARELELCYAAIALVTDHDAGVDDRPPVTHAEVVRAFAANLERLRTLLRLVIPRIGPQPDDVCSAALRDARF